MRHPAAAMPVLPSILLLTSGIVASDGSSDVPNVISIDGLTFTPDNECGVTIVCYVFTSFHV